jgi:hypothetical protein
LQHEKDQNTYLFLTFEGAKNTQNKRAVKKATAFG